MGKFLYLLDDAPGLDFSRCLVPQPTSILPVGTKWSVILPSFTSSWMKMKRSAMCFVLDKYVVLPATVSAPVLSLQMGTELLLEEVH